MICIQTVDLKELREQAGLETIDIAYRLRISETTVRNWEAGRTIPKLRLDQFVELCKAYRCSHLQLWEAHQESATKRIKMDS